MDRAFRVAGFLGAMGLWVGSIAWISAAWFLFTVRVGRYCEDAGSCMEGAPLWACAQALVALAGALAVDVAGWKALRYSWQGARGLRFLRWFGIALVLLGIWLVVIFELHPENGDTGGRGEGAQTPSMPQNHGLTGGTLRV